MHLVEFIINGLANAFTIWERVFLLDFCSQASMKTFSFLFFASVASHLLSLLSVLELSWGGSLACFAVSWLSVLITVCSIIYFPDEWILLMIENVVQTSNMYYNISCIAFEYYGKCSWKLWGCEKIAYSCIVCSQKTLRLIENSIQNLAESCNISYVVTEHYEQCRSNNWKCNHVASISHIKCLQEQGNCFEQSRAYSLKCKNVAEKGFQCATQDIFMANIGNSWNLPPALVNISKVVSSQEPRPTAPIHKPQKCISGVKNSWNCCRSHLFD